MTLTQQDRSQIESIKRQNIEEAFAEFAISARNGEWISASNRYRVDTINTLKEDKKNRTVDSSDLASYIVASSPLHCLDGWSYLGRALSAASSGDSAIARHLAYYAELRAAMSMLASGGIGIFSQFHYFLTGPTTCEKLSSDGGTHSVVWPILEHWSSLGSTINSLVDGIQPGRRPLSIYVNAFDAGTTLDALGQEWLKGWGLDLLRLSSDHFARDEASYRPTLLNSTTLPSPDENNQFVSELWRFSEPSPRIFESLDAELLRLSLITLYKSIKGAWDVDVESKYVSQARLMMDTLGIDDEAFFGRLTVTSSQLPSNLMFYAQQTAPASHSHHHLHVIARAFLLLRLASGSTSGLLKSSGIAIGDLSFWWSEYGERIGLWHRGNPPDQLTDLWADIEDALESLLSSSGGDMHSNLSRQASALDVLRQCVRIPMWSFA